MNTFRIAPAVLVLVLLLTATACSNKNAPTFPDEAWRAAADFVGEWDLFSPELYPYNESDLAVLVYGKDPPSGCEVGDPAMIPYDDEDRHWAVAVTVKHRAISDEIRYVWLDDVDSPGDQQPIEGGGLVGSTTYFLKAAKVSACYFYDDEEPAESRIEVTVAFMCKLRNTPNADWEIGVATSYWLVDDFPVGNQNLGLPIIFGDVAGDDPNDPQDYCPDIAYDPVTGDIHLVWVNDYEDNPDLKLAYKCKRYDGSWSQQQQYPVYDGDYPHYMLNPRIDVGDPDGSEIEQVGVVYTAFHPTSGPYAGQLHVGMSFWETGEDDFPTGPTYEHLRYAAGEDCGLPRIDIAPQSNSHRYCSIVFTNEFSSGHYQVIETNNMRNDFLVLEFSTEDEGILGAPLIHYGDDDMVTVSYFVKALAGWDLRATRFELDADDMTDYWAEIGSGIGGTFDSGDYYTPVVELGIVTIESEYYDNAYWAVWCDKIDSSATEVRANWGDST